MTRDLSVGIFRRCAAPPVALAIAVALSSAALGAETISGTVATHAGTPIGAILILHDLSTARVSGSTPYDHEFSSKIDGSFSLSGVPPAKYEVCVEDVRHAVLDPCYWSRGNSSGNLVDLTHGGGNGNGNGNANNIKIKVDQGYLLQVHVNDPQGVLPQNHSGVAPSSLSLRLVSDNGNARRLRLLSADSSGQDHFVIVPYETHLQLNASSPVLALSDSQNKRYPGDQTIIPIHVPQGQSVPRVVLNVGAR